MRLKYTLVKELCQLMTDAQIEIRESKNIVAKFQKLHWSDGKFHLTLMDYHYHVNEYCNIPNTALLDELIKRLNELTQSKSKIADYDELKSDIEWLEEYYEKKSWNDVTRWLTNIDSTLRETFSQYMDAIKELS